MLSCFMSCVTCHVMCNVSCELQTSVTCHAVSRIMSCVMLSQVTCGHAARSDQHQPGLQVIIPHPVPVPVIILFPGPQDGAGDPGGPAQHPHQRRLHLQGGTILASTVQGLYVKSRLFIKERAKQTIYISLCKIEKYLLVIPNEY